MRRSLWIILLFAAIVAPNAYADTYSIAIGGGMTAPDIQWNSGQTLPDIYVTITGDTQSPSFTLVGTAGSPPSLSGIFPGCPVCGFQLDISTGFAMRLNEVVPGNVINLYAVSTSLDSLQLTLLGGNEFGIGFTDTPEPCTAVLLLTGFGLLGAIMASGEGLRPHKLQQV
jgi:hypothetical protein